jgi:hypothetical protein
MENQEPLKQSVLEDIREVLKVSILHCDDDNPNEAAFIAINKRAHEALLKLERLRV